MRVLISGAGIAGPTLAWWLHRWGCEPTIVEKSAVLRSGGYIIDFWGAGYEIARCMGLLPQLQEVGYHVQEVRVVNSEGRKISGFPTDVFWRVAGGNFVSLGRGDLAAAIFGLIDGRVESLFGDSIRTIVQSDEAVSVEFESGQRREFDVVIGADGLHSRVRELVFGPSTRYEKYLGCKVAAFTVRDYEPRDELVYMMYTLVRGQVARFTMRGNRTMFLFMFADDNPEIGTLADQKRALQTHFGKSGWECPSILRALDAADQLYFDRVSQVRMDTWHCGRVSLLGDAASCISFLGGQGSALAMTAAYLLAGELRRCKGDYGAAFLAYERQLVPFIHRKQKAALRFASTFVPGSQTSIFLRNLVMRLMKWNFVAEMVVRGDFSDRLVLPDFEETQNSVAN